MRIKIKELIERSINVLELTKNETDKYYEERQKINYFMTHYKDDIKIEDWEFFLNILENKIKESK